MSKRLLVVSLLITLTGCGREPTPQPDPAAATPAAAVAAEAIDPAKVGAARAGVDIPGSTDSLAPTVFDVRREGGGGIDAVIKKVDLQGQSTTYALVPVSGTKVMDKPCEVGDRFQAEPMVDAFQLEPPKECATRVEFLLLSTGTTFAYVTRGDQESAAGNFMSSQLSYGIAADRLSYAKPEQSRRLRVLSQVAAGRALGVNRPVEGIDGKEKPTVELNERVRVFQKENGIPENGELDAPTRDAIGRMKLRGGNVVIPPAASAAAAAAVAVAAEAPPPLEMQFSTVQMLAIPAAPVTAEIIRANRTKPKHAAKP